METDFLDDPNRPGAVLGPKTIPKRTHQLSKELIHNGYTEKEVSEILTNINFNWPKKIYS